VIATGALLGPIIPPSIPMVVYAQLANESVAKMFVAGIVPD
jgi:TRAP-type C4-dicarboxylate transport system permease large subunit